MLLNLTKFIHLLFGLGLLGLALFCLISTSSQRLTAGAFFSIETFARLNRILLWLATLAMLTGTLLVQPKHFTFHTPWIQAAYICLFVFGGIVSLLQIFKKNRLRWGGYLVLVVLLLAIVHDAVTKTTFLFG